MRADYRKHTTPTGLHKGRRRSKQRPINTLVPLGVNHHPTPSLLPMASYEPSTSFYPCPWSASDILKPQPAPPPTYYLKDHVRIVYNDGDWPTTPEDEEGISEEQESKPTIAAGNAFIKHAVVSAQPLGLLSVRMREYTQKGGYSSGGSDREYMLKEGQVVFPGRCSVHFFGGGNFTHSPAEQHTFAAQTGIPQTEVLPLKPIKVVTQSRMNSRASHTVLGAANANAMKKPAAKPSGHIQVALKQAKEEKENLPLISPDSDGGLDGPLQAAGPQPPPVEEEEDGRVQKKQSFMNIDLPNPFLDSDDEFEDFVNRRWHENREAMAEEPYSDQDDSPFEYVPPYPTFPMVWAKLESNLAFALPPARRKAATSRGRTDQPKMISTTLQAPVNARAKLVSNLGPSL